MKLLLLLIILGSAEQIRAQTETHAVFLDHSLIKATHDKLKQGPVLTPNLRLKLRAALRQSECRDKQVDVVLKQADFLDWRTQLDAGPSIDKNLRPKLLDVLWRALGYPPDCGIVIKVGP